MRQKSTCQIFGLALPSVLLAVSVSWCFGQHQTPSASKQSSETLGATRVASDLSSAHPGEGCKLGAYTGTIPLSQLQSYFAGEEDLRGGMTCIFRINSKLPQFTFHFAGRADNTLGDLDITEGASSEVIQTIESTTELGLIAPAPVQSVLAAVDANFDGYQDLQLMSQCGGTGNCSYDFYLYDPKANQFVHNDFLSSLTTPSFDQAKKQVTTSSNSSASDWQNETYQYDNGGRYTLIRREESTWDRNHNTVTVSVYELRNGQMQLVDSKTTPE